MSKYANPHRNSADQIVKLNIVNGCVASEKTNVSGQRMAAEFESSFPDGFQMTVHAH